MDLTQRLAGKVAVITGGAGGIGLATGRRMHAEGATIVVGDIDPTAGKAAADELDGLFVPVDVSDEAAVDALFDTAADTYGSVDIAFNNAGISPPDDDVIETTELPAWQKVQDINLKSVYLSCRAALRHMVPAKKGSIINTASFVAVMGSATSQISYTASKGGVLAMSRELGVQYARSGIRVNALCPGPVEHAAAAGAVRQGSGAGGTSAGARPDGPVRRAGGTGRRGGVPGQRRRVVHHRLDVPGRRRHQRPLRHPAVDPCRQTRTSRWRAKHCCARCGPGTRSRTPSNGCCRPSGSACCSRANPFHPNANSRPGSASAATPFGRRSSRSPTPAIWCRVAAATAARSWPTSCQGTPDDSPGVTRAEIDDALRLREILEVGAARMAANRTLTAAEREVLWSRLADVRGAAPDDYRRLDSRLHLAIAEAAGSPSLVPLVAENRMRLNGLLDQIPLLPRNIAHSDEQHEAIVVAILAGDGERRRGSDAGTRRGIRRPVARLPGLIGGIRVRIER